MDTLELTESFLSMPQRRKLWPGGKLGCLLVDLSYLMIVRPRLQPALPTQQMVEGDEPSRNMRPGPWLPMATRG